MRDVYHAAGVPLAAITVIPMAVDEMLFAPEHFAEDPFSTVVVNGVALKKLVFIFRRRFQTLLASFPTIVCRHAPQLTLFSYPSSRGSFEVAGTFCSKLILKSLDLASMQMAPIPNQVN